MRFQKKIKYLMIIISFWLLQNIIYYGNLKTFFKYLKKSEIFVFEMQKITNTMLLQNYRNK